MKFKTAIFCALIRRPLRREEVTWNAALPHILRRGCAKYGAIAKMQAEMERLYGSLFECLIVKKGEQQILQFYYEGIPQDGNFYEGIAFLRDVMLDPLTEDGAFPAEFVEGAKSHLLNLIEGRINNKAEYARHRCFEAMCPGEPFGLHGDGYAEDLSGMDKEKLYRHYRRILETSPIDFIAAGPLDEGELQEKITGLFGHMSHHAVEIPKETIVYEPKQKNIVTEKMDAVQGKICIGLRCGCPPVGDAFYALLTANEILGGGANSKLFNRLREKESLCYYIHSVLYRFKSIILIESGIAKDNFGKAVALLEEELDNMKAGRISELEIENARAGIIKKYIGGQDYPSAIIDFYTAQYLLGDPSSVEDVTRKISQVTVQDTADAAQRLYIDTVFELA